MYSTLKTASLLAACFGTAINATVPPAAKSPAHTQPSNIVAGAYIVEFPSGLNQAAFYSNLTTSSIPATPRSELSHTLFNGASFQLPISHDNATIVDTIASMSIVVKLWPVTSVSLPVEKQRPLATPGKPASLGKRSTTDTYPPHVMGGVDILHNAGVFGQGMFIGIVDTGVDYLHPALGGGFGPGYKVTTGFDLVGDAFSGLGNYMPKADVMDCAGHGTHVSGIVGASNTEYGFTGVAPNATIGMWKVFGCTGGTTSDVLIAAFNMAHEAGVDVITASIGGTSGWTEDPVDVAVQRIIEAGTPCSFANGNDGNLGTFLTEYPAEAIGAVGVGSVDNIETPVYIDELTFTVNGSNPTLGGYVPGMNSAPYGDLNITLYATSFNTSITDDACNPLPADTPDLSSYLVLIRRGTCEFETKIDNVVAFNATRVMFYNNVDGIAKIGPSSNIPSGLVSESQGDAWISDLASGDVVTVQFSSTITSYFGQIPNTLTGGFASYFTTWGPTLELGLKPQVCAPGGNILSTYPRNQGYYAVLSGTSMATPYIGAVIALIRQVRGKSLTPAEISALLSTTAKPVKLNDGNTTFSDYAPVFQQGGGLVNASLAVTGVTTLGVSSIQLNDTNNFVAQHPFTITNTGTTAVTYTLSNTGAAMAYPVDGGSGYPLLDPFPGMTFTSDYASIRFTPAETITVPAGSSAQVVAHFTRPANVNATLLPLYSGFVGVDGSNGESLTIPYGGLAAKLKDFELMDTLYDYPYFNDYLTELRFTEGQVFVVPGPYSVAPYTTLPTVEWSLILGSSVVRIEIVPKNTAGLPRIIGRQAIGSMPGYPFTDIIKYGGGDSYFVGQLDNGTWVPAGEYRFLLRVLKHFGDPTSDHDYDSYESPYFNLQYD